MIESAPDAFVVTDLDGRILSANHAFVELAQLATEGQARGQSLERWLGRTGVDLNVLISNLRSARRRAPVRDRDARRVRCEQRRRDLGRGRDAMVSRPAWASRFATSAGDSAARPTSREMPRSVGQMTELVGRVPLKDIVRDTTDLIEQLCIEAALHLTHDNRASAAEMLGLSRQSLYVKLRRFNIGDLAASASEE